MSNHRDAGTDHSDGRNPGNVCLSSLCLCASVVIFSFFFPDPSLRASDVHVGRLEVLHFRSRALDTERTVRVWLPPGFSSRGHYGALYLNDGQNLFGDGDPDSGGGGWHVDEAAARLIEQHVIDPLIVVGIDNGGDRARSVDYLPVPDSFSATPEPPGADRYLTFVTDELMPFVNQKYPTLRGPEHTGFGGSSYGAVSAFYAVMARPGVFGRVLLESPSVGVGNGALLDRARAMTDWPERIVIGVGTGEGRGGRGSSAFQTLADILKAAGLGDDRLKVVVQEGGRHNEESWASRFPDALAFLFRPRRN
jgi:predicted alpha/beta superfamily hydrolase